MTDGGAVETALAEAVRDRVERARLERQLAEVHDRLAAIEQEVADRAVILGAESRDVEKLESFSPTRIWAGLRGSRDLDLDRETAERDAARYALAEAEARRDVALRERAALEEQARVLGDTDARFAEALEAKETWLRTEGGAGADRLVELAERHGTLLAEDHELAEAHAAGRAAHGSLTEARRRLGSAQGWSTWDTFGGGGMLSDMMKYNRIDEATAYLRHADAALKAFGRELSDIAMAPVQGVEVTALAQVFDVFFDNIFSDWSVRARVQDAATRVDRAMQTVEQALHEVSARGAQVQQELRGIEAERERLLTDA